MGPAGRVLHVWREKGGIVLVVGITKSIIVCSMDDSSELGNSSNDSIREDFCSPNKSSVENSLRYLQQVIFC